MERALGLLTAARAATRRARPAAPRPTGLSGPRLQQGGRRRRGGSGRAAATTSSDCSGTPGISVSFGVSPDLGLSARAGPRLTAAKRSRSLSPLPRPLPLAGPGLAPPPHFRSSARLRIGPAQTRRVPPYAQLPGKPCSFRKTNGKN